MDELSNRVPKVVASDRTGAIFPHFSSEHEADEERDMHDGKRREQITHVPLAKKTQNNSACFAGYKLCYRNIVNKLFVCIY